ncbi:MAG: hypothetical protein KKB57_12535 [Proteobacteria bacterium]|nr:hypothetical protein [Pseudomonadota bacterium]MBU2518405.1 hypothetical protein [Pseudomonadota bacterium]
MSKEEILSCPWCEKSAKVTSEKANNQYGDIIVRRCSECQRVIASYLDEGMVVLKKVRNFQDYQN